MVRNHLLIFTLPVSCFCGLYCVTKPNEPCEPQPLTWTPLVGLTEITLKAGKAFSNEAKRCQSTRISFMQQLCTTVPERNLPQPDRVGKHWNQLPWTCQCYPKTSQLSMGWSARLWASCPARQCLHNYAAPRKEMKLLLIKFLEQTAIPTSCGALRPSTKATQLMSGTAVILGHLLLHKFWCIGVSKHQSWLPGQWEKN